MAQHLKPYIWALLVVIIAPVCVLAGLWIWFLSMPVPFLQAWAAKGSWPVACSTRGCVTTQDWAREYTLANKFAQATGAKEQTPTQALTTTLRQHLLAHAFFKSPVTLADAKRYREQVLNINKTELLEQTLGLSPGEYDQYVIVPFLQQEALRQEREVKSTEELYASLSKERLIVLLPWHYRWNAQSATAETK